MSLKSLDYPHTPISARARQTRPVIGDTCPSAIRNKKDSIGQSKKVARGGAGDLAAARARATAENSAVDPTPQAPGPAMSARRRAGVHASAGCSNTGRNIQRRLARKAKDAGQSPPVVRANDEAATSVGYANPDAVARALAKVDAGKHRAGRLLASSGIGDAPGWGIGNPTPGWTERAKSEHAALWQPQRDLAG